MGSRSVAFIEREAVKRGGIDPIQLELYAIGLIDKLSQSSKIFVEDRNVEDVNAKPAIGIVDQKRREHDAQRRHEIRIDAECYVKRPGIRHAPERFRLPNVISDGAAGRSICLLHCYCLAKKHFRS